MARRPPALVAEPLGRRRTFAPLQARSRRNLDRILAATEALLARRRFEQVSVSAIVRAAGTSVGAFYARFPDKQALLPELYARYQADLGPRFAGLLADPRLAAAGLARRCRFVAESAVRAFLERRGLLRALALFARARPEALPADAGRAAREHILVPFARLLLGRRDEIGHPEPERAVEFALFVLGATCREKLLFGDAPHARGVAVADGELIDELARLLTGYLQAAPAARDAPPRTWRRRPPR